MHISSLLAVFLTMFTYQAFADERLSSDQEHRISLGVNIIKLGCGTGTSSKKTEVKGHGDLSFTLKKPPGVDIGGDVDYTSEDAQGLVAALNKTITSDSVHLSESQLACMRPYIKRIFDIVIPPGNFHIGDNGDGDDGDEHPTHLAQLRICSLIDDPESFFAISYDGTEDNISGWIRADRCVVRPAAPDSDAIFVAGVGSFNGKYSELDQSGHNISLHVCVGGNDDGGFHQYTTLGGFNRRNGKWVKRCEMKKDLVRYYRVAIGHSNDLVRVDRVN